MSEPEATAKQNAGKILVVDDEPALTVAFARKLRREGYECATAGSGEEALKRLESYRPDLVISDVRMPGMSGLDLLKEIKHRDPALKVILTTAYAHIEFVVEALRHGVDDYLVKPFSLSERPEVKSSRAFQIWSPRARGFCTIGKIGTARDTRWGLRARPSASLGGSSMSRTLSTPCSKTDPIARHWIRLALSASSSWAAAPALTRPCLKLSSRSCVDPPEYRDIFVRYLSAFILPEKIR